MTPELLAVLTPEEAGAWALCEKATDAPWHLSADRERITQTAHVTRDVWTIPHTLEDMDFIAGARIALPAALETTAALRAELKGVLDDAWTLATVVGVPAGTEAPMTEALRRVEAMCAEVAELQATIENERGHGAGPSTAWAWDTVDGGWTLWATARVSRLATVERWTSPLDEHPYWTMATNADYTRETQYPTARAAMKAAEAALAST